MAVSSRRDGMRLIGARAIVVAVALAAACWSSCGVAYAYHEPFVSGTECSACHTAETAEQDCVSCHDIYPDSQWYSSDTFTGPHGFYSTSSNKCAACHSVHKSPADSVLLLRASTVVTTCMMCHDGTGGFGVYGAVEARTGVDPATSDEAGTHRIATVSLVPGGDAGTGGSSTMTFAGPGGTLICTDCHSIHGAQVVEPFTGDRRRLRANLPSIYSSKLLRQRPGGTATPVPEYGSDWCLACHGGRDSQEGLHNHPVDSLDSTFTVGDPYTYGNLPVLENDGVTGVTVLSGLGGVVKTGSPEFMHAPAPPYASENRGYLMPYPRTLLQQGHAPICQQCHEDARRTVGCLVGDGSAGDAADAVIMIDTADGLVETDNPRFQNFPHETENRRMLVEEYDDLCLNCHPMSQLP